MSTSFRPVNRALSVAQCAILSLYVHNFRLPTHIGSGSFGLALCLRSWRCRTAFSVVSRCLPTQPDSSIRLHALIASQVSAHSRQLVLASRTCSAVPRQRPSGPVRSLCGATRDLRLHSQRQPRCGWNTMARPLQRHPKALEPSKQAIRQRECSVTRVSRMKLTRALRSCHQAEEACHRR